MRKTTHRLLAGVASSFLALACTAPPGAAQPAGYFTRVKAVPGIPTAGQLDVAQTVMPDGLSLIFHSDRRLYQATRSSRDQPFSVIQPLGPTINKTTDGYTPTPGPSLTADGLVLIFTRGPVGETYWGGSKLFEARRASVNELFGEAAPLPDAINRYTSFTPHVSPDGLLLLFASVRPGGRGAEDIWVAARASRNDSFGAPVNFNDFFPGSQVNSPYEEVQPSLSSDGLVLFFAELDLINNPARPGGRGGPDTWVSTRPNTQSAFGPPLNLNNWGLGSTLNGSTWDGFPFITRDWPAPGSKLYFVHWSGSGEVNTDFWEADWVPFQFTAVRPTPSGLQLDFNTKANRTFQVEYNDDLRQPGWTPLGAPLTATGDAASVTDSLPPASGNRFYRVVAP